MHQRLKHKIVLFCFFISVPAFIFAQQNTKAKTDKATALANEFLKTSRAAGMTISVGIEGEIVWSQGFGFADLEQNVPVDPARTLFRIGSVSKPMTATAVALLYEQDLLELDSPVQKYVPSFPEKRWPITTRLVAGHLAGIRHYRNQEFLSVKHYDSVLEGLKIFADDTLLFEPGSEYSYSSYGWNLVSAIVEGAAGKPFLQYMRENVFLPIGMQHTFADHADSIIVGRSRYYELRDNVLVNCPAVDNSYKWAGGGFIATSEDVVRYGFAHLDEDLLKKETIDHFWQSQKTSDGKLTNYGIGWSSGTDDDGRNWVGHGGGSVGGTTFFRMYPKEEVVVVIIFNHSGVRAGKFADELTALFLD